MKIELRKWDFGNYLRFLRIRLNKNYSGEFSQSFFEYILEKLKIFFKGQKNYITAIFVNGKLAGSVGLYDIKDKESEVGYFIVKELRGGGIATKSVKKMLNFGFKQLKLDRITAITDFNNKASQKVLRKLGFKIKKRDKKNKEFIWEKLRK